jgi:diacylglycerol kinase family enzyme
MLVQRGQFAKKSELWAPSLQEEPKVAVLLNANARQVNRKVVRSLSHALSEQDLFLSKSEIDARRIAQQVVEGGYDTVFCGGGDGTFVSFASEIFNQLQRQSMPRKPPRFGILKLGTGNGLAAFLHSSSSRGHGFVDDVLRARSGEVPRYRKVDLLLVEKKRAPFAGLGADARLLNDYLWVKNKLFRGAFKGVLSGSAGYFSAVALKTVPYFLTHSTYAECEVVNGKRGPAYRLGPDGLPCGDPIGPGQLLFRGKVMMTAAGTIPFYGFRFRIFPFAARKPGMMHLRLGGMPTPAILANVKRLWHGRWFPAGLQDFHTPEALIRFERPMPFQIGGDAAGYRDQVHLSIAPERVEMADFTQAIH